MGILFTCIQRGFESCCLTCTTRHDKDTPIKKHDIKYITHFPCDCGSQHTDGPYFLFKTD